MRRIVGVFGVFLLLSTYLFASEPKWEMGLGSAFYNSPHYLGADQSDSYIIPVPYIIYRGDTIHASREGIFSRLYDSAGINIRLSLSGSLPVNSKDNDARVGMRDLDFMLEAGPTLQIHLWRYQLQELRLDLPVRAAFSVGNDPNFQGVVFNPRFNYSHEIDLWNIRATIGMVYASELYHDYFYQVERQYVTPSRPYFDAAGGLTGARFSIGVSRRWGRFYGGSSLNYYQLSGAANNNSPLMKRSDYYSFSFMLIWVFSKSDEFTDVD